MSFDRRFTSLNSRRLPNNRALPNGLSIPRWIWRSLNEGRNQAEPYHQREVVHRRQHYVREIIGKTRIAKRVRTECRVSNQRQAALSTPSLCNPRFAYYNFPILQLRRRVDLYEFLPTFNFRLTSIVLNMHELQADSQALTASVQTSPTWATRKCTTFF
jgi:hypothetical protein